MSDVTISQNLLMHILYGSPDGQRFTQDTPILPEVWLHFARETEQPIHGLIVPRNDHQAHHVAGELHERIQGFRGNTASRRDGAQISDMPGLIALNCHFDEVVNVILPLTRWWQSDGIEDFLTLKEHVVVPLITDAFGMLKENTGSCRASSLGIDFEVIEGNGKNATQRRCRLRDSCVRVIIVVALIHTARTGRLREHTPRRALGVDDLQNIPGDAIGMALKDILAIQFLRERRKPRSKHYQQISGFDPKLIFTFNTNRVGDTSVADSVKTTKADAARRLFALSNGRITWAVIDSGIDAEHYAFRKFRSNQTFGAIEDNEEWDALHSPVSKKDSRVVARYDMTLVSALRNRDLLEDADDRADLAARILDATDLKADPNASRSTINRLLDQAHEDLKRARPLDWDLVERLTRVRHTKTPRRNHGTHVAGTLGGHWPEIDNGKSRWVEGMCPDIQLMDFNVVGETIAITEFAVIAAMRLIRHLNERNDFMVVHGANLSLAIPHDVTNYACGRTPVCVECETLVNNGVVVVAAAGNTGYNIFKTKDRELPLHTETSIADPGNAEAVITVGSTHRLEPHNYGVSYFSSRGPTGDGRMKPDLVAPGEKIEGPICNQEFATLEGTSMAAPHVSGAAALLMARFPELIGNPKQIKKIMCDTATDLGRDRAYQGRGLVDVLRALQSV